MQNKLAIEAGVTFLTLGKDAQRLGTASMVNMDLHCLLWKRLRLQIT